MMDVREKLVELLQDENNPVWRWFPNNMAMMQLADYLISNCVTVQEWISVEDRLPEPWEQVLIYSRHDFCESAFYIGVPGKWCSTWNHEMLDADSVTHWMPMPEPPEMEKTEE